MIPQMNFVSRSKEAKQPAVASHFIGLLCLSRVLRMLFWFSVFVIEHMYYGGQGYSIVFLCLHWALVVCFQFCQYVVHHRTERVHWMCGVESV